MNIKYAVKVNDKYFSKEKGEGWTNELTHAYLYLTEDGAKRQCKGGGVQWNEKTNQFETFPAHIVKISLEEVAA